MQLKRDDILTHGYSESCAGCHAALVGTSKQGHFEACPSMGESAIRITSDGQGRVSRQQEKDASRTRQREGDKEKERNI